MKKTILKTVSVIALMGALPALAETAKTQTEINAEASTTGNIVDDAKASAQDIKSDVSESYEEIKATLIGKESADKNTPFVIDSRKTANGMIGHSVYDDKHESVAKVTDIILDRDGKAVMLIVTSNAVMGTGKMAAFDYSAVTRVESDGDVIMPLTKGMVDKAASFSYRDNNTGGKAHVIPNSGYSVSRLLRGRLLDQNKESVADIENISFKNGMADQLIVGFDKTLGFGGERAVLSYRDTTIARHGSALDFQLSANRTAQFEAYKKSLTN